MKKTLIFIFVAIFTSLSVNAQETISGKSRPVRLVLAPKFKRGLPPELHVSIRFHDDNNNGILEANENCVVTLDITNKGKGPAQGLLVKLKDDNYDPALIIKDGEKIPYIYPGQTVKVQVPIHAGFNIKTATHKIKIVITEFFGYDADASYLILNTLAYLKPKLVLDGLKIADVGRGTSAIKEDGQLQAGEQVHVKVVVENIGRNVSKNTQYRVTTTDNNIYLSDNYGNLGNIAAGDVKEFWITVSPNKRVTTTDTLPIFLSTTNTYNCGDFINKKLPIKLNQKPPKPVIKKVIPNFESLQKKVVRVETNSNKITANFDNVINIKDVPHSKTVRKNAVAIVIGIEKYDYLPSAPYATNDADIIKEYFKDVLGIAKVYLYTNEQTAGFFFENTFNPEYGELQKAIIKGKTNLFVFYSGHGIPSKDGSHVYLFPSDGRIENLNRQGYDLNRFFKNLEAMGAKSTFIFIDACFSGVSRPSESYKPQNLTSTKGVYINPEVVQPWEIDSNFTVFSSSSFNQTSLGYDQSKTGLFTYFLCAGLQGKADANGDGKITSGELKNYVIKHVREVSKKIFGIQTPIFHGNQNMVLVKY